MILLRPSAEEAVPQERHCSGGRPRVVPKPRSRGPGLWIAQCVGDLRNFRRGTSIVNRGHPRE